MAESVLRTATEEEDNILHKISGLETENYNLENEYLLCKSQIKGYKEMRRKKTVSIYTICIIDGFLLLLTLGYLIYGFKSPSLALALYMGSGGLGFITAGFTAFTVVSLIRYIVSTGGSEGLADASKKMGLDNLPTLELTNKTKMINAKKQIEANKEYIDNQYKDYFELKEKNDKQYEEDVASGKIKPIINFEAYNAFVPIDNTRVNFSKAKARLRILEKERLSDSDDLDKLITWTDNNKSSVIWFVILWVLTLVCFIISVVVYVAEKEQDFAWVVQHLIILTFIMSVLMLVLLIVNFIACFPSFFDNGLADFISDKSGTDNVKKDIRLLMEKMNKDEEEIKNLKEEIENLRLQISDENEKMSV